MLKIYLIAFLFFAGILNAQFLDSLHVAFTGSKTFDFRFESRNSFVDHDRVEVQSLKLGVTFGRKISVGGGYSWLKTKLYEKYTFYDNELKSTVTINRWLRLNYICYYVDYIFYKNKRWQYSIPTQFGTGFAKFDHNFVTGEKTKDKFMVFLYEPGVNVKFKIFTWLGLGGNIGYRMVFKNNKFLGKKLNSPIYSGGVIIYWDQLALAVFPKNKLVNKRLGPVEW
ncbi:MAG: hypothetical protein Q8M29_05735 [Bacteroidota bacterium]|nr:hypothetical protein [Bacteroidota bacterium]